MSDLIQALGADRAIAEAAAAHLRNTAIQDAYAGRERKDLAFAIVLVLDELVRHIGDLPQGLRGEVVRTCRGVVSPETQGCPRLPALMPSTDPCRGETVNRWSRAP